MSVYRLENSIQRYDWGSSDAIPSLLGQGNPGNEPWAELWMGAHPKAPSMALDEAAGTCVGLDELIAADPVAALGAATAERFGGRLPFLFKVLSAARALSIQVHPSRLKAERGYDAEDRAGIPLDAPDRNYRDRNHKPETVVAYTDFDALAGFRPVADIIEDLKLMAPYGWRAMAGRLADRPGKLEMSVFFYTVVALDRNRKERELSLAKVRSDRIALDPGLPEQRRLAFRMVSKLLDDFPGDVGALAPLALNLVRLKPGQALDVGSGEPHAYLSGTAFEVMANSDNVLRGGLTHKHVDIPEFISSLDFGSAAAVAYGPEPGPGGFLLYPSRAPEYALSRARVERKAKASVEGGSAHILLCLDGEIALERSKGSPTVRLPKGGSAFVSASEPGYAIGGSGELVLAGVPS